MTNKLKYSLLILLFIGCAESEKVVDQATIYKITINGNIAPITMIDGKYDVCIVPKSPVRRDCCPSILRVFPELLTLLLQ